MSLAEHRGQWDLCSGPAGQSGFSGADAARERWWHRSQGPCSSGVGAVGQALCWGAPLRPVPICSQGSPHPAFSSPPPALDRPFALHNCRPFPSQSPGLAAVTSGLLGYPWAGFGDRQQPVRPGGRLQDLVWPCSKSVAPWRVPANAGVGSWARLCTHPVAGLSVLWWGLWPGSQPPALPAPSHPGHCRASLGRTSSLQQDSRGRSLWINTS